MIDDYTLDLDEAIEQADILVLCAPTLIAADMLRIFCPAWRPRARPGDYRCGQRKG